MELVRKIFARKRPSEMREAERLVMKYHNNSELLYWMVRMTYTGIKPPVGSFTTRASTIIQSITAELDVKTEVRQEDWESGLGALVSPASLNVLLGKWGIDAARTQECEQEGFLQISWGAQPPMSDEQRAIFNKGSVVSRADGRLIPSEEKWTEKSLIHGTSLGNLRSLIIHGMKSGEAEPKGVFGVLGWPQARHYGYTIDGGLAVELSISALLLPFAESKE